MKRYLYEQIKRDLNKKMVFIGGPRQVGKTTIAKEFLTSREGYLSYDIPVQRAQILKRELPNSDIWIFDEIHKYRQWRNYLKGIYDEYKDSHKVLVTGSARLDLYRYAGDSLQGRYHFLRMHPLSVAELSISSAEDLLQLLKLGGFPEPFFGASDIEAKRWSIEYRSRLINEEITSIEQIHDLGSAELLATRLPDLVGSPLSVNSLREDLQISHKTVSRWLDIFERFYMIFRLLPFGAPEIRAVRKERKHYHFDWTPISGNGAKFENLVACHLLKWVHFLNDTQGRELELNYFRDTDSREVDFIVTEKMKPIKAIECKWDDTDIDQGLKYFKKHFPECEAMQISALGKKDYISKENIRVCNALGVLKGLV